jgi:hypothetical protein
MDNQTQNEVGCKNCRNCPCKNLAQKQAEISIFEKSCEELRALIHHSELDQKRRDFWSSFTTKNMGSEILASDGILGVIMIGDPLVNVSITKYQISKT